MTDFPGGADGDVFRRLCEKGFDFSQTITIDFNVDFEGWPPPQAAIVLLAAEYPGIEVHEPGDGSSGYLQFKIHDQLSYELVIATQERVTRLMTPFQGICESWGVLHDPHQQR